MIAKQGKHRCSDCKYLQNTHKILKDSCTWVDSKIGDSPRPKWANGAYRFWVAVNTYKLHDCAAFCPKDEK